MDQDTEARIKALWGAVNALPEGQRAYLVRYVTKNAHRPVDGMLAALKADLADREEAAKLQAHREERVMDEYREIMARRGVEVAITGVAVDGKGESVQAKG
jgi:hypothetical protein